MGATRLRRPQPQPIILDRLRPSDDCPQQQHFLLTRSQTFLVFPEARLRPQLLTTIPVLTILRHWYFHPTRTSKRLLYLAIRPLFDIERLEERKKIGMISQRRFFSRLQEAGVG